MIRTAVALLSTGVLASTSVALAKDTPIFAHTVIQNLTPLMIMAALTWVARIVGRAGKNYRDLCNEVAKLESRMSNMEKGLKRKRRDRGKRRHG